MGIANIVNTAGGGGGSSEIITHLVNSVDGAGLRLANQGYISCADVSANRFGTNDFSVEFVLSQETSAINADIFISNFNSSNQAVDAAVIRWDVVQNDNIQLVFTNSGATETAYNFGYDPAPDLNEPTHYLVSADRSGNAVLYRNGAEIASVSIAASGSANVGNSGQPTVIGSPVNNFGVKGNVYRFRTYSKALSSDEAKNVFDRADVPTALVSNLLLDLDCAYANPTQSTVIQDRGPNNQDGTLNGTITQTNVIKQLNSTSARIGTTQATPADGEIIATGVKAETYRSARSDGDVYIQAATASDFVAIGTQVSSTLLKLDGNGNLMLGTPSAGSAAAMFHISGAAPRIRLEDTSAPANYSQIAADNGQLTLAADGGQGQASSAIIAQVDSYERMRIDSSGGVKVFGSGSTGAEFRLENTTTSAAADDIAGTVNFYTNEASAPSGGRVCGYIRSVADDQYNRYGLRFGTANYNETVAERMSIDASGITTFQKTDGAVVNLKRNDSDILNGNTFGKLQALSGDSSHTAGTEVGSIAFTAYGDQTGTRPEGQIRFLIANNAAQAEAMRIEPTKLVKFYGGIAFQSATTGSGTGVGYTLENYEYGTFTMGLSGTTATIPSGYETARYYRIGNLVYISWYSGSMTLASSVTNAAKLTGLPFNVADQNYGYSVFSYAHGNAVSGNSRGGAFIKGETNAMFNVDGGTSLATYVDGSGKYIMVTGVYETDDA